MNFEQIENALAAMRKELDGEPTKKAMNAVDFMAYAEDQVAAAKTDSTEKAELRMKALAVLVTQAAQHDFSKGDLEVEVYTEKEESSTEETPNETSDAAASDESATETETETETQKAVGTFKSAIDDMLAALSAEQSGQPTQDAAEKTGDIDDGQWPDDFAAPEGELEKKLWGSDNEAPPTNLD
jgi:hypothetical protein